MGQRAWYVLKENGVENNFYSHRGANELTPIYRLDQANEIQKEMTEKSIADIFSNLNEDGKYMLVDNHSEIFNVMNEEELTDMKEDFNKSSNIEMKITLDLDTQKVAYEYSDVYFKIPRNDFEINIGKATELAQATFDEAETIGIVDFWDIAKRLRDNILKSDDVTFLNEKVEPEKENKINNMKEKEIPNEEIDTSEKIKVLMVKPNETPFATEIVNDLKSMQEVVGGLIEVVGLDENVDIIVNEEGKLIGLEGNRLLGTDILVGDFFIVGYDDEGDFISLTGEQIEKYSEEFAELQTFTQEDIDKTMDFDFEMWGVINSKRENNYNI